jgi:hypothetical protein
VVIGDYTPVRWRTNGIDRLRLLVTNVCRNRTCSAAAMTAKALTESLGA